MVNILLTPSITREHEEEQEKAFAELKEEHSNTIRELFITIVCIELLSE